ncbi:MAG: peptidylprolyl isomerase [Clostridium sp.]|nr:peptidylprolyl isomerase [Clostridium sp.]
MENKVLAVVNGKEITEKDIQNSILRFPENKRGYFSSENGKKQLLNELISFELMYNDAVDNKLDEEENFKKQIEAMKREILAQFNVTKVLKDIKVTDKEAKDYYETHKTAFCERGKVSAKHILVDSEEKALKIKEEIKNGKAFEDAAKEYSTCPSKERGGDLGSFSRGQMVPEFETVAFSQEIGVVSEPVKTQFGYHLIKVESKTKDEPKSYEEVKDTIIGGLTQERQNMRYTEYVEKLKGKYKIEIK